jgi:hypothetical protein
MITCTILHIQTDAHQGHLAMAMPSRKRFERAICVRQPSQPRLAPSYRSRASTETCMSHQANRPDLWVLELTK